MEYFPIEEMWEYVLNKTNQGKYFREFRGKLMNVGKTMMATLRRPIRGIGLKECKQKERNNQTL